MNTIQSTFGVSAKVATKAKNIYSNIRARFTAGSIRTREMLGLPTGKVYLPSGLASKDYQRVLDTAHYVLHQRTVKASQTSGKQAKKIKIVAAVGANMEGLKLSDSSLLQHAVLPKVNLKGANLQGSDLRGANFSHGNLSNTDLTYTNLSNVKATGANLSRSFSYGADISDIDLSDANLSGVYFWQTRGQRPRLNNVDARGSYWFENKFEKGSFTGDFTGSYSKDNQGLPKLSNMTQLPATINHTSISEKSLNPQEYQNEIQRVQKLAFELGITLATKTDSKSHIATAYQRNNTIGYNPYVTSQFSDATLRLVLGHEATHIKNNDRSYIQNLTPQENILVKMGLLETENHKMEYLADRGALMLELNAGTPPRVLKQAFYNQWLALNGLPQGSRLPNDANFTHPSYLNRYREGVRFINEYVAQNKPSI